MLLNRKEEVQATIQRLAEGPEIAAIRIYDKRGSIAMSLERGNRDSGSRWTRRRAGAVTGRGSGEAPPCWSGSNVERVDVQPDMLRHLSVIDNEPRCSTAACHAHAADETGIGRAGPGDVDGAVARRSSARHNGSSLWATLILIFIIGVVAADFIRRVVQRPVSRLYEGTRRIAEGDLDTRIEVRGRDELARLAEAFNQMAGDLSAARREVVGWSQKLEEKVVEKTEELSRVQRQVLQMEKMASLGKLSATVAHEINNPLSGMLAYARLVRRELAAADRAEVREEMTAVPESGGEGVPPLRPIVQNLLLFVRGGRGPPWLPCDLNEVVERSLMLVRHHLEIKGREAAQRAARRRSARSWPTPGRLQQALVALLVNAIEAMSGLEAKASGN